MPRGFLTAIARAKNPKTPPDELRELSTFPILAVKVAVSQNPNAPPDVRERLNKILGKLSAYEGLVGAKINQLEVQNEGR